MSNSKLSVGQINARELLKIGYVVGNWNSTQQYYAITNSNITEYFEGLTLRVRVLTDSTNATDVKIKVGNLPSKPVKLSDGTSNAQDWKANSVYTIVYNGSNFILQGEGGDITVIQNNININGTVNRQALYDENITSGDPVIARKINPDFSKKITNSGLTPFISSNVDNSDAIREGKWTDDDNYLVLVGRTTPFLLIYKKNSDDELIDLLNPITLPPPTPNTVNFVQTVSWSKSGIYLAVSLFDISGGNRIVIYKRNGDAFSVVGSPIQAGGTINNIEWRIVSDGVSENEYLIYTVTNQIFIKTMSPTDTVVDVMGIPNVDTKNIDSISSISYENNKMLIAVTINATSVNPSSYFYVLSIDTSTNPFSVVKDTFSFPVNGSNISQQKVAFIQDENNIDIYLVVSTRERVRVYQKTNSTSQYIEIKGSPFDIFPYDTVNKYPYPNNYNCISYSSRAKYFHSSGNVVASLYDGACCVIGSFGFSPISFSSSGDLVLGVYSDTLNRTSAPSIQTSIILYGINKKNILKTSFLNQDPRVRFNNYGNKLPWGHAIAFSDTVGGVSYFAMGQKGYNGDTTYPQTKILKFGVINGDLITEIPIDGGVQPGTLSTTNITDLKFITRNNKVFCLVATNINRAIYEIYDDNGVKKVKRIWENAGLTNYISAINNVDTNIYTRSSNIICFGSSSRIDFYTFNGTTNSPTFVGFHSSSAMTDCDVFVVSDAVFYVAISRDVTATTEGVTLLRGSLNSTSTSVSFSTLSTSVISSKGAAFSISFSPDGKYLALGKEIFPFLELFEITNVNNDQFVRLSSFGYDNPNVLPKGNVFGLAWNKDASGNYYLMARSSSWPYFTLYKSSSNTSYFQSLSDVDQPSSPGNTSVSEYMYNDVVWSPNGRFLANTIEGGNGAELYVFDADSFRESKSNPSLRINARGHSVFHPTENYLLNYYYIFNYMRYSNDSGKFTRMSYIPEFLPTFHETTNVPFDNIYANHLAWSPRGDFLSICHNSANDTNTSAGNYISIYHKNSNTLTSVKPSSFPAATTFQSAWSFEGKYLACTTLQKTTGKRLYVYQYIMVNNDYMNFSLIPLARDIPAGISADDVCPLVWHPYENLLVVGQKQNQSNPNNTLHFYRIIGGEAVKVQGPNVSDLPTKPITGVDWTKDGKTLIVSVDVEGSSSIDPFVVYDYKNGVFTKINTSVTKKSSKSILNFKISNSGHFIVARYGEKISVPAEIVCEDQLTILEIKRDALDNVVVKPKIINGAPLTFSSKYYGFGNNVNISWSYDDKFIVCGRDIFTRNEEYLFEKVNVDDDKVIDGVVSFGYATENGLEGQIKTITSMKSFPSTNSNPNPTP